MVTSFLSESIEVQQAKQAVEVRYGSKPGSPADFAELSLRIKIATGNEISPDTLSRIWGYKKGYSSVRHSTIKILDDYSRAGSESDFIYHVAVNAEEMSIGGRVQIAWLPDRIALLEYKGDYRWEIMEIVNSKLHVGDTFSCRVIAQGSPLIVDNVECGDQFIPGYSIGGKNGLTVVRQL